MTFQLCMYNENMLGIFQSKKALVILILMILAALFLANRGQDIDSMDSEQISEIVEIVAPELDEIEFEEIEQKTQDLAGGVQAGILYADLFCTVADPMFWEDFFDGKTQTEEDLLTEDRKLEIFYEEHGYPTEFAGNNDISIHWGEESFKESVRNQIESQEGCIINITDNGIIVDDLLNGPKPEM